MNTQSTELTFLILLPGLVNTTCVTGDTFLLLHFRWENGLATQDQGKL